MKSRRAFTLLELLVVIAIIAILSALLYTALGSSRKKSQAATSMNNLRQWGSAFKSSLADNDGRMPFDGQVSGGIALDEPSSWFNRLPPYLNEKPLNDPERSEKPPRPGEKSVWINPAVPPEEGNKYIQPPQKFLFCYAMNYFLSTSTDKTQPAARIERLSATVLMAEKNDEFANCNPEHIHAWFGSGDPLKDKDNAAHFLFCDGHVDLIKRSKFDPNFMSIDSENTSPIDTVKLNPHFTFVPYVGATSN
jgi:prepilin-type N-terminal cleavage/methylation domain-containing protein/prepilin-type processing-associated H-X9-DG protein